MKIKLLMLVGLFAFGFAVSANAGAVADIDSDGVPDAFDNCSASANALNSNGPLTVGGCTAQENFDGDAFGDSCDADYNNDGAVNGSDFTPFFAAFSINAPIVGDEDANCDGQVNGSDFTPFFIQFLNNAPGIP
jgi:hypothetical protein